MNEKSADLKSTANLPLPSCIALNKSLNIFDLMTLYVKEELSDVWFFFRSKDPYMTLRYDEVTSQ